MKRLFTVCAAVLLPAAIAHANVITDWDAKAMDVIQGNAPAPPLEIGPAGGQRIATIMHLAMFTAVGGSLLMAVGLFVPARTGAQGAQQATGLLQGRAALKKLIRALGPCRGGRQNVGCR